MLDLRFAFDICFSMQSSQIPWVSHLRWNLRLHYHQRLSLQGSSSSRVLCELIPCLSLLLSAQHSSMAPICYLQEQTGTSQSESLAVEIGFPPKVAWVGAYRRP